MSNRTKLRLSYCILQETLKFKIKSGNININNDKILAYKNLIIIILKTAEFMIC